MRNEPIRAVVLGVGNMGKLGVKFMYQKGIRIVGAVVHNPASIGIDLGDYVGLGVKLGVPMSTDLDAVLDACDPDIVIVSLFSFMDKCEPMFNKILSRGINVLTTCDEGHYSWNTAPEATIRLDKLAKENGCTITASGLQDVFWMQLPCLMASGMVNLRKVEGVTTFNAEDYGPSLGDAYNIGRTLEEFNEIMSGAVKPNGFLMRSTNDAICSKLGLIPSGYEVETLPYLAKKDTPSALAADGIIRVGQLLGTEERVTTHTRQGIEVVSSNIGYVYSDGESDICTWKLYGDPDVEVSVPNLNSAEFTMGDLVNRIPDVINARPGYVTVSELGSARYYAYPMEHYVD